MVINISGVFNAGGKTRHRPLINQIPLTTVDNPLAGVSSKLVQKQKFFKWFKSRPELNSPIMIRVDDTISEVEFFKTDSTPLGRNKRLQAEKFWNDNFLYERLKSVQYDRLVTGSGFLWVGRFNEVQIREITEEVVDRFWFEGINMKELKDDVTLKAIDEDLRLPRIVDYIASSTVLIEHDKHEIRQYIQHFLNTQVYFKPNEIIHIPLIRADGKVDGWTPLESLTYEIILIWAIKENMLAYIRNGGSPSKAWILEDEVANSENFKWLETDLANRGTLENRHSNFVVAGKVRIEDLDRNIKDMEYEQLSLYVTSLIAYAYRVPVSRVPFLIGKAASKGDAGGMAESGYWSMIEAEQRTLEMHLNSQLFKQLGFSIKFKKRYKIDDLREAQALNIRADAVTKTQDELNKVNMRLTDTKLQALLDLSSNDVQELSIKDQMAQFEKTGLLNKSFVSDKQVMKEPDKIEKDATKRRASQNNPKNKNQTGY